MNITHEIGSVLILEVHSNYTNQPYLYLTVKTIIKCCDESFKIVLIDDGTFDELTNCQNIYIIY